jgi:hypothetical protein
MKRRKGNGYVPEPTEYERSEPSPKDPFTDPDEIAAVLEETRRSIEAQTEEPT